MADYIQKDLDLIRMAGNASEEEDDDRKKVKHRKSEKVKKSQKLKLKSQDTDESGSSGADDKEKFKKRSKTLSPQKLSKDIQKLKAKEKSKTRKSMGGTKMGLLGKIKIPAPKKQTTPNTLKSSASTDKILSNEAAPSPPDSTPLSKKVKTTSKVGSPAVSARSKKSLDPDAVSIEAIRFEDGAKIEAVDHGQWYKARIIKVDNKKMDILVHFDGWGARFDTWFPMTSTLIRGRTQLDVKIDLNKYESGEDVLAKWTDGNFYPATVLSVKESGSCNVMYFDGMKKLLRPNVIKKMSEKEKESAMKAVEKLLLLPPPPVIGSPQSSVSAESPSSEGRRYKTSANDRGRRSLVRGGPTSKPTGASKTVKRAIKRRASRITQATPAVETTVLPTTATVSSKQSSDDDTFIAKKARLDKITSNLISKVSPTSKSDEEAFMKDDGQQEIPSIDMDEGGDSDSDSPLVIDEETVSQPPKKKKIRSAAVQAPGPTGARGPRSGNRRGRPKRPTPRVPSLKIKVPKPKEEREQNIKKSENSRAEKQSSKNDTSTPNQNITHNDDHRQQASEALLQLSQASTSTSNTAGTYVAAAGSHTIMESEYMKDSTASTSSHLQANQSDPPVHDPLVAQSESPPAAPLKIYKTGDIVLAKWADCRSYLAYVMKKEPDDFYKIRYYDGMVKSVKSSFIHPWVGPLPDALKIFKPKSPPGRKKRSKSSDVRQGQKKRNKIEKKQKDVFQRRRTISLSKTDSLKVGRTRRRTDSGDLPVPTDKIFYAPNEKVLAKWTDLKWYPATVVSETDNDHYQVKYHDNLTRIVRDTWLTPWKPPAPSVSAGQPPLKQTDTPSAKHIENQSTETETVAKTLVQNQIETPKSDDAAGDSSEKDVKKPEVGSITESGEVVGLGEQAYKTYEKFNVDDTVLARWTDCRSYPATVKELLENGKYVVQYYDGMRGTIKPAWLKSWNPSALPPAPAPRRVYRKPENRVLTSAQDSSLNSSSKTQLSIQTKDKPGRLSSGRQSQMPRQVVRGYDAYYARLPAQNVLITDHHKYKCRVPGCTKSFRREEMLRTHHKYYHQQRYKLRDHDSTSSAPVVRRRTSKEDSDHIRRRVSADYETITKGLESGITEGQPVTSASVLANKQTLRSRGAKPPMDIYKEQHGNVSISSTSSMIDSSSGVEEARQKPTVVSGKVAGQPNVDTKLSTLSESKAAPRSKRKGSRKIIPSQSFDDTVVAEKGDNVLEEAPELVETQVSPEPAAEVEEDTPKADTPVNEDVIRCVCNSEEEEGFMIQCDGCFTWQHGLCVGVDQPNKTKTEEITGKQRKGKTTKDGQVQPDADRPESPEESLTIDDGYICWVCKNPRSVRKSRKYLYNNDYIVKGKLPSLSNLTDSIKDVSKSTRSHTVDPIMLSSLMDEVTKMQETLTGIKQKIQIVSQPSEHPLLKTFEGEVSTTNNLMTDSNPVDSDENHSSTNETVDKKLENGFSESDTVADKTKKEQPVKIKTRSTRKKKQSASADEDREAYVRECRENLLDYILSLEAELDNRLTRLTDFMSSIDSSDEIKGVETLQEDLTAVQKLLSYC